MRIHYPKRSRIGLMFLLCGCYWAQKLLTTWDKKEVTCKRCKAKLKKYNVKTNP